MSIRVDAGHTICLFLESLNASSARSFCGKSFAFGITLDNRANTFSTGAGGVTSSAILAQLRVSKFLLSESLLFHIQNLTIKHA